MSGYGNPYDQRGGAGYGNQQNTGYGQQQQQPQYGYAQQPNNYSRYDNRPANTAAQQPQPGYQNTGGQNYQAGYGQPAAYGQRTDYPEGGYAQQPQTGYSGGAAAGAAYESQYQGGQDGYGMASRQKTILEQTREMDREFDRTDQLYEELYAAQTRLRGEAGDNTTATQEVAAKHTALLSALKQLTLQLETIKKDPKSGEQMNVQQVGKVAGRLREQIKRFDDRDKAFKDQLRQDNVRQYQIAYQVSKEEAEDKVTDSTTGVFQQALLHSDRQGRAQSAMRNVQERHQAIAEIEKQMIELAALFTEVNALVEQQAPKVEMIEQKGAEAEQHLEESNKHLTGAIEKRKAANRKKWWCLLIVVLIIIVIAIVLAILFAVVKVQGTAAKMVANGQA